MSLLQLHGLDDEDFIDQDLGAQDLDEQDLDYRDLYDRPSQTNSDVNDSDTSSDLGSDYTASEQISSKQQASLKRMRESLQSSDTDSSQHDATSDDQMEGVSPPRHRMHKRRQRQHSRRERFLRFRSPSPFYEWEVGNETSPPSPSQSSDKWTDSQLQSSEGPDSAAEMDWTSFFEVICEDSEMLPSSNWEADFLAYQAQLTAGGEDAWFPYDPESLPPRDQTEAQTDPVIDEAEGDKMICYGVMHKRRVKILSQSLEPLKRLQSAQPDSEMLKERKLYLFKVFREDGLTFLLQPPDATNSELRSLDNIAVLNKGDTTILSELAGFCRFEVYSSSAQWISIANETTTVEKNTFILVDILIYGPKRCVQEVGQLLDAKKVFLQEPDYWDVNLDYSNPHLLDLSSVYAEPQADLGESRSSFFQLDVEFRDDFSEQIATPQSLLKERIATAFKNMTRAQNLKRISADVRIRTNLKPYQEEALDFIMQRESGPVPEEYCLWKSKYVNDEPLFTHAITGCEKHEKPIETGGGILADEMGLGKTLTMLSATIRTADEANAFASNTYHDMHLRAEHALIPSRATLVVVPSPLLLNEWKQEIKLHCAGISNINEYHGRGREGNAKALADSDIVLSTYHTISHESIDKESPLWKIKWFRIILDEGTSQLQRPPSNANLFHLAHVIRRMSTKLFKAMKKLRARYYWCLTGTPVQNRLEDLAALISFIRASPLDDLHKFRKHVIAPLIKGSENGVENLRQLLDSVCLRRTKQLLHLPEAIFEPQYLRFSAREEQQYNDTRDKLVKLINKNGLKANNQKGYLGVFQLQLQLRRLCNHGTFQKASLGADEFDPNQAIALLKKQKNAKCEACSVHITGIQGIEEKRSGSFTVCGHLLCMKCVQKMKSELKPIDGRDGCFKCSLCLEVVFGGYLVDEEGAAKSSKSGSKNLSPWQYFDKEGCSTKVSTVVADIEHHKTEGKSIVFSCWTRSLDLIGIFLTSRKIPFVRIDGSHSLGQRKWILENYQKDPAVKILLMTTGTGAVGLNLTVANCVYLLEPQWNPMVENQAIARVLRLGQTRNVRVVRYIMKGTVEEKEMQSQQVRKLEYAKAGWKEDDPK